MLVAETDLASQRGSRAARFRRGHIGFVLPSPNLLPALSVRENAGLLARLAGHPVSRAEVDAALEVVGLAGRGVSVDAVRRATAAGGHRPGTARRAARGVRRADQRAGRGQRDPVLDELRALAGRERTVVMVTHDLEAAARADRVLVLRDRALPAERVAPTAQDVFDAVAAAGVRA